MEKTWKSSSTNSVSMYRKRVQWTRFPCTETEFNELDFHLWKTIMYPTRNWFANNKLIRRRSDKVHLLQTQPNIRYLLSTMKVYLPSLMKTSSMNSFSMYGKRVHWTRFTYMETEFVELDFHVFFTSVFPKSSPLNSNCYKRN